VNNSSLSELVDFWTGQLSHSLVIHFLAVALTGESFISERASGLLDRSALFYYTLVILFLAVANITSSFILG
jgi:hypothetical protein